jgi:prophage regulatory protein
VTENRCLRLAQVIERIGIKETALRQMMARGEFPAPFKIGARAIAWLEADVDAWISERARIRVQFQFRP